MYRTIRCIPTFSIGDKGLFTKELEDGILDKNLDFAVHSLKDMPTSLPSGLIIGAIGKREIPNDALILNDKNKEVLPSLVTIISHLVKN